MLKAIKEDNEEALKAMIKAGKNLAEPNKDGWLPLHEAAYYGQLSCLQALHRGEGPTACSQRGEWHTGQGRLPPTASCSLPHSLGDGARQGYHSCCRANVTKLGGGK